jgi:uroporphyrinogen decarboxylase
MAEMTSRERVICALNHEEPDRVPLDIGGGASTSIVVEGYEALKSHLGISAGTEVLNRVFRVAKLDEAVLETLGSDCYPVTLKPPEKRTPSSPAAGVFTDLWGIRWREARYHEGCFYYELMHSPLADADIKDLDSYPWPDSMDPGFTRNLAEETRRLFNDTQWALVGDCGFKSFWELAYMLRGYDRLLMDLVTNPGFVHALLSKLYDINEVVTGRFLDSVGPYIQVFRTADDVAMQRGSLMSTDMYKTYLKPVYRKYYDFVRTKTDARIFYHSCGNVADLLDEFIDNGIDILNPIQVGAMPDTAALKGRFGERVVFWGAIDTQRVLPRGTEEEVAQEVKRRIRDLGRGGGYVLSAVHNIQPDVPPQNILAMARAARRYGAYPIR